MTDRNDIASLGRRLVGAWTSEATHPAVPGTVVLGTAGVEWLEGERLLIWRARVDHPDFPDSLSVLGDTDGLCWHYFDSRGVHRLFELSATMGGRSLDTFPRPLPTSRNASRSRLPTWTPR